MFVNFPHRFFFRQVRQALALIIKREFSVEYQRTRERNGRIKPSK